MANLIYTPKDILDQEFKTKMRGYDPIEVDEYLDNIIKDYETFQKQILALQEENDRLAAKLAQAETTRATVTPTEAPKSQTVTNFDILKRLSNLEKEVFGKKLELEEETVIEVGHTAPLTANYTTVTEDDDLEKTRRF